MSVRTRKGATTIKGLMPFATTAHEKNLSVSMQPVFAGESAVLVKVQALNPTPFG